MSIEVVFQDENEIQRCLYLLHRDLARVVGNQVLADEQLEAHKSGRDRLSGRMLDKARQVVATTPKQERIIKGAQSALRDGLKQARREGVSG